MLLDSNLKKRLLILLHIFILSFLSLLSSKVLGNEPVRLVVNESRELESISLKELRAIYTMRKKIWSDGEPVKVFVLPAGNVAHIEFCKKVLGVFPRQLESVWYRLVYSGTGSAPIEVSSDEELVEMMAKHPGAIGYSLKELNHEQIKTISVR